MFLECIRRWLEMSANDRRRMMSGDVRPIPAATGIPRAHLEYLANPDTFNIRDRGYRICMQTLVNRQIHLMHKERERINGRFAPFVSAGHREALESMLPEYERVGRYLNFPTDNFTRTDLLKCLGFMYGMQIDRYKTAECIKYVLAANGQDHQEFAEIVLETDFEVFNLLITYPERYGMMAAAQIFGYKMGMYLIKSFEERKQAWIDGCRKDHLEFLENPYTFNLDKPGFKRRMLIVVEPQWAIMRHWLGDGPLQVLKEDTEHLVNFLANQRGIRFDEDIIRRRIINLAYMDGMDYNEIKMAECIGSVLRPEQKERFARNVLNCHLETFEFLLASPVQHSLDHVNRINQYLLMNCEGRQRMLNGI